MTEKILCPVCSKVSYVKVPGKFECQKCKTRFIVNATDDIEIIRRGKLKILTILVNLLLLPVIFTLLIIISTMSGDFF